MKTWTKPSFREISMNAEIGSYQSDEGGIDRISPALSSDLAPRQVQSRGAVAEMASVASSAA